MIGRHISLSSACLIIQRCRGEGKEGAWRKYHEETQKKGRICRGEGTWRNSMRRPRKNVVFVEERVRRESLEEIS
jgi:hypothetical protein